MNIALDISPISGSSKHSVRGVGSYIRLLMDNLPKYDPNNIYTFFSGGENIPKNSDVIHYPYFDSFHFSIPRGSLSKTIVTVHDLTPIVFPEHFPSGLKGKLFWNIQRQMIPFLGGIITVSESAAGDVRKFTRISSRKVYPVHLAADQAYGLIHDKKRLELAVKKFKLPRAFVLYVGDVTWNKNLPFIMKSCINAGVPLVMVGKAIVEDEYDRTNPWNHDRIIVQELISAHSNLLFPLGFVSNEDLCTIYNLAAALLMPSRYEGFGLPVLEAMQSGCPVITAKNGSLSEVGGDAVMYVDSDDNSELILIIQKIAAGKKIREEYSGKGITQAKKFTIKKTIQETVKVYESVGKKK